jgi:hypothetical protein
MKYFFGFEGVLWVWIMGSQNVMGSDYGSNISVENVRVALHKWDFLVFESWFFLVLTFSSMQIGGVTYYEHSGQRWERVWRWLMFRCNASWSSLWGQRFSFQVRPAEHCLHWKNVAFHYQHSSIESCAVTYKPWTVSNIRLEVSQGLRLIIISCQEELAPVSATRPHFTPWKEMNTSTPKKKMENGPKLTMKCSVTHLSDTKFLKIPVLHLWLKSPLAERRPFSRARMATRLASLGIRNP